MQGGLLNLITRGEVVLPNGSRIDTRGVAFIADSNYQAESEAMHTLVPLDDALRRRFEVALLMDILEPDQEVMILEHLIKQRRLKKVGKDLIQCVVRLGARIREHRREGSLTSLPPPSIAGYLTLLEMTAALEHLTFYQLAKATMLGCATAEDQKLALAVYSEVFGVHAEQEEDDPTKGGLF